MLDGCWASRGKIQHNDLPLLLVAGGAGRARRWACGGPTSDEAPAWGWPVRTSIVVVTGIYFLTGFQKLVASGPAWVLSDNLRNVMYGGAAHRARRPPTRCRASSPTARWLAHGVALVTIVVELGAVVALVWPRHAGRLRRRDRVLHAGVFLTHGLDYSMWVGTAAIVLIDWRAALLRRESTPPPRPPPYPDAITTPFDDALDAEAEHLAELAAAPWGLLDDPELVAAAAAATDEARDRPAAARVVPRRSSTTRRRASSTTRSARGSRSRRRACCAASSTSSRWRCPAVLAAGLVLDRVVRAGRSTCGSCRACRPGCRPGRWACAPT